MRARLGNVGDDRRVAEAVFTVLEFVGGLGVALFFYYFIARDTKRNVSDSAKDTGKLIEKLAEHLKPHFDEIQQQYENTLDVIRESHSIMKKELHNIEGTQSDIITSLQATLLASNKAIKENRPMIAKDISVAFDEIKRINSKQEKNPE